MTKNYVLGFAFSRDGEEVVLIIKQKPDWQKGKLNGIGGKIEPEDESPLHAMIREFKEETGVDTTERIGDALHGWNHFGTMIFTKDIMGGSANVYLFKMFSNCIHQCKTMEEEKIITLRYSDALLSTTLMHNLPLLLRIAKSEFAFTVLEDIKI